MPRFRNRFFYLLLLNLFFALGLKAQQEPYFSTYFTNPGIVNPSLSSTFDNSNVTLIYRSQWSGYTPTNLYSSDNSPNTGILSLNLKSRDKLYSFGFNFNNVNKASFISTIFSFNLLSEVVLNETPLVSAFIEPICVPLLRKEI